MGETAGNNSGAARWTGPVKRAGEEVVERAGGPARLQVIALLGAVLALDTADKGTVSAIGGDLKQAFDIGNTEFGLLLAVVSFAGALGALPMGRLVDLTRRRRILIIAVALWSAAMGVSGFATSYVFLLATRMLLGVVTAVAWPAVASLTGDFFPARDRAAVYGMIIGGELVGAGAGYFVAGEVTSVVDWRWAFYVMAGFSLALAGAIWKWLPEPSRGGQSWLEIGESDPEAASGDGDGGTPSGQSGATEKAQQIVEERRVEPREELILREDPTRHGWLWAIRYCMRIPSYRLLILASALAYYFFSGARAFVMIYFTDHYGLSQSAVGVLIVMIGIGALAGVIGGGRFSRHLLDRGKLTVRILLPAAALVASVPFLGIGIWVTSPWAGIPAMTAGAGILAAAIAPIDAARLDIVHPMLWGRAEAGRMALRMGFEGSAPLVFGLMSRHIAGGGTTGLEWTFLIMLAPMILAAALVLPGRRTYPRDVATAAASVEALRESGER